LQSHHISFTGRLWATSWMTSQALTTAAARNPRAVAVPQPSACLAPVTADQGVRRSTALCRVWNHSFDVLCGARRSEPTLPGPRDLSYIQLSALLPIYFCIPSNSGFRREAIMCRRKRGCIGLRTPKKQPPTAPIRGIDRCGRLNLAAWHHQKTLRTRVEGLA
jgi:hypothetical protein